MFSTNHLSVYGVAYKAPTTAFADIANHWAKGDIEFVASRGLLRGTSATAFSPNTAITKGMLATALGRLAGIIVNKNGNRFAPAVTATRAEVSAVLRRYVELVILTTNKKLYFLLPPP